MLFGKRSLADFAFWGDSLTSGSGSSGATTTYPYVVANAYSPARQFFNGGAPGETSTSIKDRMIADTGRYRLTSIFWAGRNDYATPTTVKANIATMIAALTSTRYLVLSILSSTLDSAGNITTIGTLNSDLSALYGTKYCDVRAALMAANDGSANDLSDVANGYTPRSLRTDEVHLNDAGYAVVATTVKAKLVSFGL